jgi:hypothetical protein
MPGIRLIEVALILLGCTVMTVPTASAQNPAAGCHDSAYGKLDFWVGRWDVYLNDKLDGTDVVEKILKDCAVVENWREANSSGEGKSLFYYLAATKSWKQVWVTDAGPLKEKKLITEFPDGGIRFQGEIPHADGTSHLDRTTLTPVSGGKVHQLIEISRDAGKTWQVVYDAEYRPQTEHK